MSGIAAHDPLAGVCVLADELASTIGLARALAESGRAVDLTGLDSRIGLLCAKSLDLPPEQGRAMRHRLISLSGSIEALSRALTRRVAPSG
jgi:hypothetical protein